MTTPAMTTPEEVLAFWFGPIAEDGGCGTAYIRRWWAKDPDFDREVRERFGDAVAAAESGQLPSWRDSARGCLALVLLCDQMTRNSRRGTGAMYAADAVAQELLRHALDRGYPDSLRTMECYFLYMPLMHAESPALQREGVERFDALAASAEPGAREQAQSAADYMRRHEEVVARFGRFPHRNALLGRESTPEELAFLEQPGSSF